MLEQASKGVGKHLVRAIADEYLICVNIMIGGDRIPQIR